MGDLPAGDDDGAQTDGSGGSGGVDGGTDAGSSDTTGTGETDDSGDTGDDSAPLFDVGSDDSGSGDDGGQSNQPGDCNCLGVMDGIYLLSASNRLWFFNPQSNAFSELGPFICPAFGMRVNSMAIDRSGYAWVNYFSAPLGGGPPSNGGLFAVDLQTLQCQNLGYQPGANDFKKLGMAFATDGPNDTCDDLYGYESHTTVGPENGRLGEFIGVPPQLSVLAAGNYPNAELSGTGDGRLFAFANTGGDAALVEYDKATGAEVTVTPLPGLTTSLAYAFAFWGGDVFFFTMLDDNTPQSKVTRLDLDGNAGGGLSTVVAKAPDLFIGAGVSTCASFTPPG